MKCDTCHIQMKQIKSVYIIERSGYRLMLQNVLAYVCPQCEAQYFDEAEIDAIQQMVEHLEADMEVLSVAG